MKKNLLLLVFLCLGFLVNAQDIAKTEALQLVAKNLAETKLSNADLENVIVSSAYHDRSTGLDMIYLQQSYKGLPVYNQIQVLAFKNGAVVSNNGGRISDIEKIAGNISPNPSIAAGTAVTTAMAEKKISTHLNLVAFNLGSGTKLDFGKLGIAHENVTAELMWVPLKDGKQISLAWQVYLVPNISSDYWMIRVDANKNKVINETNLTVYCDWKTNRKTIPTDNLVASQNQFNAPKQNEAPLFDFAQSTNNSGTGTSPTIINSATYRVIKYPAESPRHTGGAPALVTDPWTAAPGNATSLKWHSNGTTDYNITRSNNVWSKEDHAGTNSNAGQPATSTTPDPLTFDFTPNFSKAPNQTSPVPNQQFNITNLFYWNNLYHDILYQYGFDEPSGNFQANNQGRGGQGNDFVYGDAQDGNFAAGSQSNANFSTPADGGNGRMQMYLWDTAATLMANAPAAIAGRTYSATESGFSTANKLINVGPVTGQVVYYNDQAATTHEACVASAGSLTGKIALIIRGNCNFTVKVKNAQLAGAIAVIMVNNVAGNNVIMAGSDNSITIPAVFVSQTDGTYFASQIANNLNVTLYAALMDGDVDNGVITHEHSHGLSNRLTGGPAVAGCLGNAEQMGEGWSDYYSLMLTQNWATTDLSFGFEQPRTIGTYAIGQAPTGNGIRTQPYCTDFTVNNLVYGTSIDPESHNRGELWCATLWDMTWNIIAQVGTINPNIYDANGVGGNSVAMKLVTQGMKLQPCSPGFIDARNAILQADQVLYGGAYACAIKAAFTRRGMGANASQGSSDNVDDQVPDFVDVPCANCTGVTTTTPPANTTACTGSTATFTVVAGGTNPTYQWQVSTGGPFTNIAGATSATLSLPAVTAAMNGYQYQVVISNTCPSTITTTAATLTVNSPASITTQASNTTVCVGENANFSVTAAGSTNTYQWQVSTGGPFSDVAGATTATLNLTAVTAAMNGYQYQLVITSCGPTPLVSTPVTLTVNSPATISAQPANTNACTGGGDATFTVTAVGTANTYQWQVSTGGPFTNIAGATSASLTVTGITSAMNGYQYQVVITNPCTATLTSTPASLTVSDPATITTQPVSSIVCEGSNTSFTIATAGSGVTYQWQVSTGGPFTNIAGATSATLNLSAVTAGMNNNVYHVLVYSCSPTGLSSSDVTLTVNAAVAITTPPANTNACVGSDATFTVTAAGTANTYQWQVSTGGPFTDIPGATSSTLTLTGVTAGMNNNVYQVVVGNSCTAVNVTSSATLTVSNAASITTQPVSSTVCAGSNATFTATAAGASYQWQVSTGGPFTDITGATTTTLTLPTVTSTMNGNQYQLVIGSCGASSITSTPVTLTVNDPASISSQPTNATVCDGANATFAVSGAGTSVTYQWQVSTGGPFTDIAGATTSSLALNPVTAAMNNNQYQVILTNTCTPGGLTSTVVTLTVNPATSITAQPTGSTICEGDNVSFTAAASNAIGYQWQVSTGGPFTDIAGATGTTLTLTSVTASMNNYSYHVVATGCGSVTSDDAVLNVNAAPVVTITAAPLIRLSANQTTTLTATATPAATSFNWYKDNVLVPGNTSYQLTVNFADTGTYHATVNDANGCLGTSDDLKIGVAAVTFIYPNPNNGHFWVHFPGVEINSKPRIITLFDGKGARVLQEAYADVIGDMEVHAENLSSGTYSLVLTNPSGEVLGTGKVVIGR
ncbi:MAG: M36 family metallopeptidase [Ferruginibacter sp.]